MESTLPKGVCVIIVNNEGKALCVSRPKDPTKWGLVGGKVDPGETPIQACVREVSEEVGLTINSADLVMVYQGICHGEVIYDVTTFAYEQPGPDLQDLVVEDGLIADYFSSDQLTDPDISPFAGYNERVIDALRVVTSKTEQLKI